MGINQGLYTSTTDLWETPQDFFDGLDTEFCFELDVCALPENAKCDKYYSPDDDGWHSHGRVSAGATRHTGGGLGHG